MRFPLILSSKSGGIAVDGTSISLSIAKTITIYPSFTSIPVTVPTIS